MLTGPDGGYMPSLGGRTPSLSTGVSGWCREAG